MLFIKIYHNNYIIHIHFCQYFFRHFLLAKETGISKVYQCYINDNNELDKKLFIANNKKPDA